MAAEDQLSSADTASVRSDHDSHDVMMLSPASSGPRDSDAPLEDSCEVCCHDCCSPSSAFVSRGGEKYYTICQVRRHNTKESAWLVAGDTIYDATPYVNTHPGGETSILRKAGGAEDVSRDLHFHSPTGKRMFQRYKIGKLRECGTHDGNNNKPFWVLW